MRLLERRQTDRTALIQDLRRIALPIERDADLDPLLDRIGEARIVLLGEASHGTHEFYDWRARISRRLIVEKGFSFLAVEGDWPDCYRVNRYVRGHPDSGESARAVLYAFDRWPTWMWANREVEALVEWLRQWNDSVPEDRRAGFYGLDVYSLWESMHEVVRYLESIDPEAARNARQAYRCFEPYGEDAQEYAWATRFAPAGCEEEVVRVLVELRRNAPRYLDGKRESFFDAEQNALAALDAERYYRAMVRGGPESWNIRDRHMAATLDRLLAFHGPASKAIVWEHNTHIGDARATDMARSGMVNVGQLARERHAAEGVVLVGFASHRGSVIAAREWGAPMRRMRVPPAREGSWEALFHDAFHGDALLPLDRSPLPEPFFAPRGHRAIGVVYNPEVEAYGNYVQTVLPRRYDVMIHLDHTRALEPLHVVEHDEHEPPETYPSGV